MKLKVLGLSLAGLFMTTALAQEVSRSTYTPNEPGRKVSYMKTPGHWFLQLRGGINAHSKLGSGDKAVALKDKIALSVGVGLGKWHNPYFGTRLMVDYNQLNSFTDRMPGKTFKTKSLNPHIDFMFDMMNYFGQYNPDRGFSIRPYIGVGAGISEIYAIGASDPAVYTKDHNFITCATGNAGIDFDIRLASRAALNIGIGAAFGNFSNIYNNIYKPQEIIPQLRAGLTFGMGNQGFEAVEPMDYALLNDLNSQINSLRAQNEELSKRPVSCPECPEVEQVATVNNILDNVVYFRLNSARVDRNQLINVYNTAEFVKANNVPIKVVGYADEKTGTADYNMKLSERRAREVARILVEEHGVPSNLITIDFKGSSEQIYAKNAWNRVVIMKAND